jgi:hypothetical protein
MKNMEIWNDAKDNTAKSSKIYILILMYLRSDQTARHW